jgi:hypothetical protein
MKLSLLFPILLLLSIAACKKPVETTGITWSEYSNPIITHVSLYDTLPKKSLASLSIKEINGIKAEYGSGKSTAYFEYEANAKELIKIVSLLPFKRCDSISDTLCRKMEMNFSLSAKSVLSSEETNASNFFWDINPMEYAFYECIKGTTRHTILVNKLSNKILHRIETLS